MAGSFSGCHNRIMTVLDTTTGRVIVNVPLGENVDGNGFDAGTELSFSSNGDGALSVVREASSGKFEVMETVTTQRGSRTMAIDPITSNIFLPAAQFSQSEKPTQAGTKQQPVMVNDSFEALVFGK
jgi:hypothetical protein